LQLIVPSADLYIRPNPDVVRRPQVWIIFCRLIEAQTRRLELDRWRNPDVVDAPVETLPLRMSRSAPGLAQRRERGRLGLRRTVSRGHQTSRRLVRRGVEVAANDRMIGVIAR